MDNSRKSSSRVGESGPVEVVEGKIIAAVLIVFSMVFLFLFLFYLYSRWLLWRHGDAYFNRSVFAPGRQRSALAAVVRREGGGRGLDPSVLSSIPIVIIGPKQLNNGSECAVCLCELSQGEKARLLNPCNHGFHVECIDVWFHSHSTCPLCRTLIVQPSHTLESNESLPPPNPNSSTESPDFPTNVLFWGNQTQVASRPSPEVGSPPVSLPLQSSLPTGSKGLDGVLVIKIPSRQTTESGVSSVWASPRSPIANGIRSLRRILSRDRRSLVSCSPSACQVDDSERGDPESLC